jgi:hypothetical protein
MNFYYEHHSFNDTLDFTKMVANLPGPNNFLLYEDVYSVLRKYSHRNSESAV